MLSLAVLSLPWSSYSCLCLEFSSCILVVLLILLLWRAWSVHHFLVAWQSAACCRLWPMQNSMCSRIGYIVDGRSKHYIYTHCPIYSKFPPPPVQQCPNIGSKRNKTITFCALLLQIQSISKPQFVIPFYSSTFKIFIRLFSLQYSYKLQDFQLLHSWWLFLSLELLVSDILLQKNTTSFFCKTIGRGNKKKSVSIFLSVAIAKSSWPKLKLYSCITKDYGWSSTSIFSSMLG